jgi:rod shape-determining protein MreD
MRLTVAAIGAIAAALLEVTILPAIGFGGAQPDLVLIAAVVWTFVAGFEGALVWAFVGGLMLDVLTGRPLGSTAFTLLICVGIAAVLARVLEPLRLLGPAVGMFPLATLYAFVPLLASTVVRGPIAVADPLGSVAPRVIADTLLAGLLGGLAIWSRSRGPAHERLDW